MESRALKDGTEYRKICPESTDKLEVSDEEVMGKYMKCASRVFSKSSRAHSRYHLVTREGAGYIEANDFAHFSR